MKMTAPRLVARAGRSRFLIGLGILVLMAGFVAIFHSSQQQLDELRQLGLRCEQQQEAISAKMQVVVDQKLRLEHTLASERLVNEQSQAEQQQKTQDEKEQCDKSVKETNIRYASLQQHYNLMKSQLDDLTEECSKSKKKQLEEINSMRLKVTELQGKVALHQKESADDVELLKAQVAQLKLDKETLDINYRQKLMLKEKAIEKLTDYARKMEKENSQYIALCKIPSEKLPRHIEMGEVMESLPHVMPSPAIQGPSRNFAQQISVSEDLYKIPVVLRNRTSTNNNNNFNLVGAANVPPVADQEEQGVLAQPFETNDIPKHRQQPIRIVPVDGGVINSVENFQIIPKPLPLVSSNDDAKKAASPPASNVLQEPQLMKTSTSVSVAADKKTSERSNNMQVPIVAAPTMIPPTGSKSSPAMSSSSTTAANNNGQAKKPGTKLRTKVLPVGIVPFPENMEELIRTEENNSENAVNNRYLNVAASHQVGTGNGADKQRSRSDKDINFMNPNADLDNGANEVNDNDFNLAVGGAGVGQLQQPNNLKDANNNRDNGGPDNLNAAEEDTNLYDQKLFPQHPAAHQQQHGDYSELLQQQRGGVDGKGLEGNVGGGAGKAVIGEKLINEIVRDHGKEGDAYPNGLEEDLHLDGQQEAEEEGDVSDYDDPAALKQGHAERN
ncbi:uncharacterized protein LOC129756281 isoform X1 [Uranotaenia lowii]|uniref:uncharacterized protein LOC129756281 isoform X1 n=1 Tax=Uranotaenia lowii TaxID=190385 RepID=UPI00247B015B|nr:uncharacterized protein LOC129756281 isoform X1 [Uranotaenia lowii]